MGYFTGNDDTSLSEPQPAAASAPAEPSYTPTKTNNSAEAAMEAGMGTQPKSPDLPSDEPADLGTKISGESVNDTADSYNREHSGNEIVSPQADQPKATSGGYNVQTNWNNPSGWQDN